MDLARAAHREALRDMQPPPERTPIPGLTTTHTPARPPRDSIFGQLFALISRCVRQTMLLEDRLAAGDMHHQNPESSARSHHTPPLPAAAPAPGDHTRIQPDRLRPESLEDETRDADDRPFDEILADIRTALDHAATTAGQTPATPRNTPATPRRPIPVIPPGPPAPLSAFERSVLRYHHMQASLKKPDG